jgi:hypothetical protein
MDERDGFISWLRGEFAAANAIIDLLVLHLRSVPGDYDHVFAAVHQRRHHWAHIIHMQQFFPVTDVALALQHTEWLRRAQQPHPQPPTPPPQQHGPVLAPNPPPPPARRHSSSYAPSHNNHRNAGNGRTDPPRPAANVAAAGSDKDGESDTLPSFLSYISSVRSGRTTLFSYVGSSNGSIHEMPSCRTRTCLLLVIID